MYKCFLLFLQQIILLLFAAKNRRTCARPNESDFIGYLNQFLETTCWTPSTFTKFCLLVSDLTLLQALICWDLRYSLLHKFSLQISAAQSRLAKTDQWFFKDIWWYFWLNLCYSILLLIMFRVLQRAVCGSKNKACAWKMIWLWLASACIAAWTWALRVFENCIL